MASGYPSQRDFFPERHRRAVRVTAHRADLHVLGDAGPTGFLQQVQAHRLVGVPVPAGVGPVRPDPADLRGEVDHDLRAALAEQPADVGLLRQVALGRPRHDERGGRAGLDQRAQVPAEEAGPAGDEDPFAGERHRGAGAAGRGGAAAGRRAGAVGARGQSRPSGLAASRRLLPRPRRPRRKRSPTRIRTWTNRTKICGATVTLSGNAAGRRRRRASVRGRPGER